MKYAGLPQPADTDYLMKLMPPGSSAGDLQKLFDLNEESHSPESAATPNQHGETQHGRQIEQQTADDNVKILQPLLVPLAAHFIAQQEVHQNVRVVPQTVGSQEQLPAAVSQGFQVCCQPGVLLKTSGFDMETA